jgi:hypothetical protein
MSLLKPAININPNYSTNSIDNGQAGWYQVSPTTSNLALRVSNSNIGITGEIKLNTTTIPSKFQGYNGTVWVDFNATQGPQGAPGLDFTNTVNFNNLTANTYPSSIVGLGQIFATTQANIALNISNVNIRSLQGGNQSINSNLTVNSLVVSQNSNVITLTSQGIPYKWNFANPKNTISYLKNASSDSINYGWGDVSTWTVKNGINISKGQAVQITTNNASSNLAIIPINYTSLTSATPFNTNMNMLGIALENASNGQTCNVCTHGITTVLCTSNITSDFTNTNIINVGLDGIVGKDGGIFCNNLYPLNINYYTRAGYFLESGNLAANGNYVLFFVEPQIEKP